MSPLSRLGKQPDRHATFYPDLTCASHPPRQAMPFPGHVKRAECDAKSATTGFSGWQSPAQLANLPETCTELL
jgi:hypothetical protein